MCWIFSENIVLRIPVLYGPVENLEESAVTYLFIGLKKSQHNNELFKVSSYELRNPSSVSDIANIVLSLLKKKIESVSSFFFYINILVLFVVAYFVYDFLG